MDRTIIETTMPNWVWLEFHAAISERMRQVSVEKWSFEHDDTQVDHELAAAAASYALPAWQRELVYRSGETGCFNVPEEWPIGWEPSWFRPANDPNNPVERLREIDKAIALLAAEKGRIMRIPQEQSLSNL